MSYKTKIRIIFTCVMLPALIGGAAMAYLFRVHCSDLTEVPGLHNHLLLTLYVIEGLLWTNVFIALVCILMFFCRRDDCPVAIAFQSCLVVLAVGMACWTFYSESIRYQANAKKFRFTLYENWTEKGVLHEEVAIQERRRYDYENFKFLESVQSAYGCCGLSNYLNYNENVTQEWLHVNLTTSCTSKGVAPPMIMPDYCKPILEEGQEIPQSCCKAKGCNTTDVFHTGFNLSAINKEPGCTRKILKPFEKCTPILPFVLSVCFILAVYMPMVAYGHARRIQDSPFWNKFCCYCLWTKSSDNRQSVNDFSRIVMQLSRRHMSAKVRKSIRS